jgi:hypothetical protein
VGHPLIIAACALVLPARRFRVVQSVR